jgi:hypothetical protein
MKVIKVASLTLFCWIYTGGVSSNIHPPFYFMEIHNTLSQRKSSYGAFSKHAEITQKLKDVLRNHKNWESLDYDKKESLEMILHKIARIVNGDSNLKDSWHDIIGYAKLVENTLKDKSMLTIDKHMPNQNCLTVALAAYYFDRSVSLYYDEDHVIFKRDNVYYDATGEVNINNYPRMLPLNECEYPRIMKSFELSADSPTAHLLRVYYGNHETKS